MYLSAKTYHLVKILSAAIYLTAMYNIASLIFGLETGHVSIHDKVREEMFAYLTYLSAAIIPLFVHKKEKEAVPTVSSEA